MKILIAEDERSIAQNYKLLLESQGHQVVITDNGQACLQLYEASLEKSPERKRRIPPPFDIVMLDVRMPKIGGVEVAKRMMSLCPRQRIIMATAYGDEPIRGLVEHLAETIDVLQKPFDLEALAVMINKSDEKSIHFPRH